MTPDEIRQAHDKSATPVILPEGCTKIKASLQQSEAGPVIMITGEKDGNIHEFAILV